MKQSSLSMLLYALYAAALALSFLLAPNPVITLFGFAPTSEVWIRIMGYLLGVIAYLYMMAIRVEERRFYRWTVYARLPVLPLFALFAWLQLAPPALLLFGAIDLLFALWTMVALRGELSVEERA